MKSISVRKNAAFPQKGETLLHLVTEGNLATQLTFLPKDVTEALLQKAKRYDFGGKEYESLTYEWRGAYETLILVGCGPKKDLESRKIREAVAVGALAARQLKTISITVFPEFAGPFEKTTIRSMVLGYRLANHSFIKYKGEKARKKIHFISSLEFIFQGAPSEDVERGITEGMSIADGVLLARDLVNDPASHVDPAKLAAEAIALADRSNGKIRAEILDESVLKELGAGAFLSVARGSDKPPRFIVLHYVGTKREQAKKPTLCFIGKSITFDSGGLSLKPAAHMEDMKTDMAGGATVLGVFSALASMDTEPRYNLWGILPACENMPSGRAMKPGDVITAINGKTIEVLNTDAEGRLALADALSYAEKFIKPDYIIDMATLTGACMVALGTDIAGVFGSDRTFTKSFLEKAKEEGEEMWELPLHSSYISQLKSSVADLKNIGSSYGGALTAALFLKEFVSKSKWIHVDIAGPSYRKDGQGSIPSGGTGFGLLTVINYILS